MYLQVWFKNRRAKFRKKQKSQYTTCSGGNSQAPKAINDATLVLSSRANGDAEKDIRDEVDIDVCSDFSENEDDSERVQESITVENGGRYKQVEETSGKAPVIDKNTTRSKDRSSGFANVAAGSKVAGKLPFTVFKYFNCVMPVLVE